MEEKLNKAIKNLKEFAYSEYGMISREDAISILNYINESILVSQIKELGKLYYELLGEISEYENYMRYLRESNSEYLKSLSKKYIEKWNNEIDKQFKK